MSYFSAFLMKRYNRGVDTQHPGKWKTTRIPHSKQPDGLSCGVYVLKVFLFENVNSYAIAACFLHNVRLLYLYIYMS